MNFEELKSKILNCRVCQEELGYELRPIFLGNERSLIMQISQAPSYSVYKTSKPWNDLSGKKLIHDWYKITDNEFYNPNNFYITDLAHCYPGKNDKGKGDNKPPVICKDLWMKDEIRLVNCKLYIIIGSYAAKYFFPKEKFDNLIFQNNIFNGRMAIVLPHPSPLNIKWFKDHPEFYNGRIVEVRNIIHEILGK